MRTPDDYKDGREQGQRDRQAEIDALRAALEPFAEIARRRAWDAIGDDSKLLDEHVIDAPADDIAPGAAYCLMIRAFRDAARVLHK